ncbi:MAG: hypothetical protein JNL58_02560 [Planctomyces sp.]|nr:hypothetical protein [Planctomyces sp.]
MKKTIVSEDADSIRRQMDLLRSTLDVRADRLAVSTQEMLNWRTYVRRYPLGILAIGVAAGVFLTPAKREKPIALSQSTSSVNIRSTLMPVVRSTVARYLKDFAFKKLNEIVHDFTKSPARSSYFDQQRQSDRVD